MKNKKLMFVFAMLSLVGMVIGWDDSVSGILMERFFEAWFVWSVPLIIQLIYMAIFRGSSKSD
jgi:hypothetical protein